MPRRHPSRRCTRTPPECRCGSPGPYAGLVKTWLDAELRTIGAEVVVCLGKTAAQVLLGGQVQILRERGQVFTSPLARRYWVTLHPSAILRAGDPAAQETLYLHLVEDLKQVALHHPS